MPLATAPANEQAQQSLRKGDWGGYGQATQKLGQILKQMPANGR